METLMELVNIAKIEDKQNVKEITLNVGNELKELGFNKISDKILKSVRLKNRITNIAKQKYLKITTEMINSYLDNKVNEYNKIHGIIGKDSVLTDLTSSEDVGGYLIPHNISSQVYKRIHYSWSSDTSLPVRNDFKIIIIEKHTCDYFSSQTGTIGKFVWKECPIEEYDGIPPKEVLDKLRIHKDKELFDYFTIASVENIKDPLLFGRINESDNRYFIAQWGSDIFLDDLI